MREKHVRPVRRYSKPSIPKRDEVDLEPRLLRAVPKRWQGNQVVISALTAALALGSVSQTSAGKLKPSRVAPIFEHGGGHASFGGLGQMPVFLSEDEARKVIAEEARKAGIRFLADGAPKVQISVATYRLRSKPIPHDDGTTEYRWAAEPNPQKSTLEVQLDGADGKKHVNYEYVSYADYREWEARNWNLDEAGNMSTAYGVDLPTTALVLANGLLGAKIEGVWAVFYDPFVSRRNAKAEVSDLIEEYLYDPYAGWNDITDWGAYEKPRNARLNHWEVKMRKQEAISQQLAREELRKQVRDFVRWLKAQGVI